VVALRGTFPSPDGTAARVDLVDTRSLRVTPVFVEGATTTGHQWLSPDGRRTYVAIESAAGAPLPPGVAVIDNRRAEVVATWAYLGGGRPHGVYFEARPARGGAGRQGVLDRHIAVDRDDSEPSGVEVAQSCGATGARSVKSCARYSVEATSVSTRASSGIARPVCEIAVARRVDLCEEGVELLAVREAIIVGCLQREDLGTREVLPSHRCHPGMKACAPPLGGPVAELWAGCGLAHRRHLTFRLVRPPSHRPTPSTAAGGTVTGLEGPW
jgi:hypothetical protein